MNSETSKTSEPHVLILKVLCYLQLFINTKCVQIALNHS